MKPAESVCEYVDSGLTTLLWTTKAISQQSLVACGPLSRMGPPTTSLCIVRAPLIVLLRFVYATILEKTDCRVPGILALQTFCPLM